MILVEQQPIKTQVISAATPLPDWRLLFALFAAFLIVRLTFIFTVPFTDAPDENCHHWMIAFLCDHLRLPSVTEVSGGGVISDYGSLPPFGYVPHVMLGLFGNSENLVLIERFGSLLSGIVLFVVAYALGRDIFHNNRLCAVALPMLVAFHPQLAFVQAYANCDATAAALSAVALLLAVRSVRRGIAFVPCIVIGVLTGWLILSKYSATAVIPAIALLLIAAAKLHKQRPQKVLLAFAISAGIAVALSGWWFTRNAVEFSGDIFGTKSLYQTFSNFHPMQKHSWLQVISQLRFWRLLYFSYWGLFSYMTKYMWRPIYFQYTAILICGLLGLVRTLVVGWQRQLSGVKPTQNQDLVIWLALGLAVASSIALTIYGAADGVSGPQGRYLFPVEVPFLSLLLAGLFSLSQRWGKFLVVIFVGFNTAVCLGVVVWFIQMYGFHWNPLELRPSIY